jgi:hypothetical protein
MNCFFQKDNWQLPMTRSETIGPDETGSLLERTAALCNDLGRWLIKTTGAGLGACAGGSMIVYCPDEWVSSIRWRVACVMSIGIGARVGESVASAVANRVFGKGKTH